MQFCVDNGTENSDKFDSISDAIAHANRIESDTIFFIDSMHFGEHPAVVYVRRNKLYGVWVLELPTT